MSQRCTWNDIMNQNGPIQTSIIILQDTQSKQTRPVLIWGKISVKITEWCSRSVRVYGLFIWVWYGVFIWVWSFHWEWFFRLGMVCGISPFTSWVELYYAKEQPKYFVGFYRLFNASSIMTNNPHFSWAKKRKFHLQ